MKLPLEGVRVADFTWIGAGSYATKILADFGADVVKIESNQRLDSLRLAAPYKDGVKGVNRSGYFADRNTSKRSMTLNMQHPRALELARRLIEQSDVIANNFTPGVMERFGLDYGSVQRMKPDIVYLNMAMNGASGPERGYLGYGSSMASVTGLQHLTGLPGRIPAGTGTNYPDHVPNPCHAAVAVLAALRHRRKTGEGQYIDMAQTEPTIALLGPAVLDYTVNGRVLEPRGNDHPDWSPHGVYACAGDDRWIAITVTDDTLWQALAEVLGGPDWMKAPALARSSDRVAARERIDRQLGAETARWTAVELTAALQARGVPASTVESAADVTRDPQLLHRGHWVKLAHAEMGESLYNAPPFRSARRPVALSRPAPLLGEHTREVCGELLGLTDAEIEALRTDGALV